MICPLPRANDLTAPSKQPSCHRHRGGGDDLYPGCGGAGHEGPRGPHADDDRKTSGFRIVYREWPEGYDPLSKGERPEDRRVHGKLALPPLKGPTPDKNANGNGSH